jgi:hypothetical protein
MMAEDADDNTPIEVDEDDRTFVLKDEETGEERTAFVLRRGEVAAILGGSAEEFSGQLVTADVELDDEDSEDADASDSLPVRLAMAFLGRLVEEPEFVRDMLDWYEAHLAADAAQDEE